MGRFFRDGSAVGRERVRPANRLPFSEMVVPYREPSVDHFRRTAFDIGEWGLGFMTTSLELGCDCLGEVQYIDAVLHNSVGEPSTCQGWVRTHGHVDIFRRQCS